MKFTYTALAAILASAASATTSCSAGNLCPEDAPCCSLYGECGTGSYCLGPCDPQYSYNLTSCAPAPICKSGTWNFTSTDDIIKNTKYLGDADAHAFVVNNDILEYDDAVLLTMSNGSTGTVLTSSRAIWYGKVSVTLKTSRTQGVVSSFILMSGVRDEIDYEFIGSYLETAQTNYYWQDVLDYDNSQNITLSDTFANYHTYEVDWTEDTTTWYVDGQAGRTLSKSDTYNSTSGTYAYPQTPAFIQISLWPGGLSTNAEGTIAWAGGEIDWNAADIVDPGYFYVTVKDVTVTCYDVPSNATVSGSNSYVYTSTGGLGSEVSVTNDTTILGSFEAVGFDVNLGSDSDVASASGSVVTEVGSGNNHSGDNTSDIPTASAVTISATGSASASATGTSSESLENASEVSKSTTSKSTKSSSSTKSSTTKSSSKSDSGTNSGSGFASDSSASETGSAGASSATSTASSSGDSGFDQGSTTTTTSAKDSNGASGLAVVGSVLGGAVFVVCALVL